MRKKVAAFFMLLMLSYLVTMFAVKEQPIMEGYEILFSNNLDYNSEIVVDVTEGGITKKIGLEQYIIARLPECIEINCEIECLKAQAILLRTQFLKEYKENGSIKHEEQDGYVEVWEMKEMWGEEFQASYNKLVQAVFDTKGIFLVYDNEIILPSYFKVSNGDTRNGKENLWNKDYPYLQSVACTKDFLAENYYYEKEMTVQDFKSTLGLENITLLHTELEYDSEGYCKTFKLQYELEEKWYQVVLQGERIRNILQIPSSSFEFEIQGDIITIQGTGCGHGIGLSQYGANELAKNGLNFMDILSYFFYDVDFDKIE